MPGNPIPLNEFITLQRGHDLPHKDRVEGNVPVVASTGVAGYHNVKKATAPGVVIGRSGSIGGGQFITEDFWPLNTTLWVKDFKGHNERFVYYLLKNIDFTSFNVGSGVPTLNRNHLSSILVEDRGRKSEDEIVKILGDIDDKIALNTEINQTLEAMAQAMFKSWFVDFEPVKAKMQALENGGTEDDANLAAMQAISGKTADQLATLKTQHPDQYQQLHHTASLFPTAMQTTELGEIPVGWGGVQIGDIVQRLKPKKRYTKNQVQPYGKTPVYEQGATILLGFHNDDAGFDATPEDPVFIFGDHTCITHLSCSKFDISSNVIPLKGNLRPTIWVYYAVQGKQEFQEYRRHWSEFVIKYVVLPPVDLTEEYARLVTTKYLTIESLKRQSKELEQLRDSLLPKLLSGEIDLTSEVNE